MTDPLLASEGWGVIHCYYRLTGDRREAIALAEAEELTAEFTGEAPYQAIWNAPLGDRADLGLMLIGPDMVRLERFRGALSRTELGRRLEPVPELGLVSMTELSEYTPREGSEEHMAMLERRVHPRLPRKRLLCFYPMAKRREGGDNWYSLDYDQRRKLMGGHGRLGAKFSGARDPADHGRDRPLRLGVGRDAAQRRPEGHQGHRLRDALRRGLGAVRGVWAVHGGACYAVAGGAGDRWGECCGVGSRGFPRGCGRVLSAFRAAARRGGVGGRASSVVCGVVKSPAYQAHS